MLAVTTLSAATFTWVGNEDPHASNSWTVAGNWSGGAVPTSNAATELLFGESYRYDTWNDIAGLRINRIVWGEDAGAYTIEGSQILFQGTAGQQGMFNNSLHEQTVSNELRFQNIFTILHSGTAGLVLNGSASATSAINHFLVKTGSGVLTIQGDYYNTLPGTPKLAVENGRTVIDFANGAVMKAEMGELQFGDHHYGVTGGRSSEVVFLGKDTVTNVNFLEMYSETYGSGDKQTPNVPVGYNQIIVDANGGEGVHLTFRVWRNGSVGSMHFDVSSGNATVGLQDDTSSRPNLLDGAVPWATIKDEVKTGFVTYDGNQIVRYTGHTTLLPTNSGNANTNFKTSGNLAITNNHASVSTLTIQGGGTMTGNFRFGINRSILMEEGVGDYTFDVANLFPTGNATVRIFQYSVDGNLIIKSPMGGTSGTANLIKAGPGLVIVEHAENTALNGYLQVQNGPLQLDGGVSRVTSVVVYGGATLLGSGTIGGGDGGSHYTPVLITDGGVLDASNVESKSLTIAGSLSMESEANYRMTILDNSHAALHVTADPLEEEIQAVLLAGNLALSLADEYKHVLNSWIYLLTTNGEIEGQFLTVNNQYFIGEGNDEFVVDNYSFRIVYDLDLGGGVTAVALYAIPEPATIALLSGLALAGLVWVRRRRVSGLGVQR